MAAEVTARARWWCGLNLTCPQAVATRGWDATFGIEFGTFGFGSDLCRGCWLGSLTGGCGERGSSPGEETAVAPHNVYRGMRPRLCRSDAVVCAAGRANVGDRCLIVPTIVASIRASYRRSTRALSWTNSSFGAAGSNATFPAPRNDFAVTMAARASATSTLGNSCPKSFCHALTAAWSSTPWRSRAYRAHPA